MRNYGVNEFDNKFRIIGDEKSTDLADFSKYSAPETVFEVFHKILIELCEDTNYLLLLKRYILDYFVDKIHIEKNKINNLHKNDKYFTTLDGTKVRSKSEQYIADWFYRHSIKYEPLLNIKDFYFHPDFYVPAANLYIEHISDKSVPIDRKEEQFSLGGFNLVKTYDGITKDTAIFNHTLDKVVKSKLPSDYHKSIILNYKEEFSGYHEYVKDFVKMVVRVTDMIKVEGTLTEKVLADTLKDPHERIRNFYELAIPIINEYISYCTNKSYLDFNDLILKTIKHQSDIANKFKAKYDYILVDEFQDVNNLQVDLLKLMLIETTQLFCVGDDWQSIYGFRGSNINYIVEFEKHFTNSQIIKLNLNYRNTQKIVVFSVNDQEENIHFCIDKINELTLDGLNSDDILFLYRRNKMFYPFSSRFKNEGIRVQGKTIHAAKGLEAKVVFIIGLSEGYGGFPDIWLEDRIFQVVKKANHDALLEEERRFFYVAITRAKEKLFLITEKGNESIFLAEIPNDFLIRTTNPIVPILEKIQFCKNA